MASGSDAAPVIIKKKKNVSGDGHHGGAWKVAYADFVTAMMAFFLLMWLLSATTEKQRKGLADYFNPTVAVNRMSGGGDGALSGDSVLSEETMARVGRGASSLHATEDVANVGAVRAANDANDKDDVEDGEEQMANIQDMLIGMGGESLLEENEYKHVEIRLTDEGVIVELFDRPGIPLFDANNQPTLLMERLGAAMASVAMQMENDVAVEGHVRAQPLVVNQSSVWEDSQKRATTMRTLLEENNVPSQRIGRTTAHADRELVSDNPLAVRNNRLEVIFLRN